MNIILIILLCWAHVLSAQVQPSKVENGPLHEAFITANVGNIILEAAPNPPPTIVLEKIPPSPDSKAIWISGYWEWYPNRNDFIWVPGLWRLSPPERVWVSGSWVATEEGWVRVHGFWSDVPVERLKYIQEIPPDNLEESPSIAPAENYFWMSGYWEYDESSQTYAWLDGQWAPFDPNWIYVPAYYVWRPDGYVFVNGYWDWPVENVGTPYASVYIPPNDRPNFVFVPTYIVQQEEYISNYFVNYPNYLYFFHFHFFFNRPFWDNFDGVPSWWLWSHWWAFNPHAHWGVWWWWTHPNYPQPLWLNQQMAARIGPPPQRIVDRFQGSWTPPLVTPKGVVTPRQLLDTFRKSNALGKGPTGKVAPILPKNPALVNRIKSAVDTKVAEPKDILKPSGPKLTKEDLRRETVSLGPVPDFVREGKKRQDSGQIKKLQVPSKPTIPVTSPVKQLPKGDKPVQPVTTPDGQPNDIIPPKTKPKKERRVRSKVVTPPPVPTTPSQPSTLQSPPMPPPVSPPPAGAPVIPDVTQPIITPPTIETPKVRPKSPVSSPQVDQTIPDVAPPPRVKRPREQRVLKEPKVSPQVISPVAPPPPMPAPVATPVPAPRPAPAPVALPPPPPPMPVALPPPPPPPPPPMPAPVPVALPPPPPPAPPLMPVEAKQPKIDRPKPPKGPDKDISL